MLENQRETQKIRRQVTGRGLGHEVNVYVPLGLVKPKDAPRRNQEFCPSAEQGTQEYQLTEKAVERQYEHDEFLQQVIKGQEKNLAIIGEPGAGKTTWLEQIALYVNQSENSFPICIPLGNLGEKTLEDYLLQKWLKDAQRFLPSSASTREELIDLEELFKRGKVWLLLDGVDEMRLARAELPLQKIANHLTGWVALARVLLTCRLNVWEANPNALPNFDIYRTLNFNDEQVRVFIEQWFVRAKEPKLGEQLKDKLGESGRERIRDLIKNPLRLALLCKTWKVKQGELPKTKATLYQRFRDDFYKWKEDEFPTEWNQRQELNAALGQLALAVIRDKLPLRERVAYEQMGESWFKLARNLGWLNLVYRDAETDEPVYAFFHLTFQEYFAAYAIPGWDYFLNHVPDNPTQGTYRIFEPQWREVILLWLGRPEEERPKKQQFIEALSGLEDGCKGFYKYRAYFLAAAGIAEFGECPLADQIVAQIVKWGFGYFNSQKQEWETFSAPIVEGARALLPETDRIKAITALLKLLKTTQDEDTRMLAADSLWQIDPGNEGAIKALIRVLETTENKDTRMLAAQSLGQIGTGNEGAIKALIRVLETTKDEDSRELAADSLGQIGTGNEGAIKALIRVLETTKDEDTRWQVAQSLGQIGTGNDGALKELIRVLETTEDEDTRMLAAQSLGQIGTGNEGAIKALIRVLETTKDEDTRWQVAKSLGQIDPGNEGAIKVPIRVLKTTEDEDTRWQVAESLGQVGTSNEVAIRILIWVLETDKDKFTRRRAAQTLGQIGTGNEGAIKALIRVLETTEDETTEDEHTRMLAAKSLGEIGSDNEGAIKALIWVLETTEDEHIRWQAAKSLGQVGTGNEGAITELLRILETTENKATRRLAAESLQAIWQDHKLWVIPALKNSLSDRVLENNFDLYNKCYKVLWDCAQNLPYLDFYQAWHQQEGVEENTNTPSSQRLNLAELPKLLSAAIDSDSELKDKVQLICIDGSKFIDRDNPATRIYNEMRSQGCPKSEDGKPKTMAQLQDYWDELRRESDKLLVLVFYESTPLVRGRTEEKAGFSETFLNDLSKFDGNICVVKEQPDISLKSFSPNPPNLVEDIVAWIHQTAWEH